VLSRFEHGFASGDPTGLIDLFVSNASVNGSHGKAAIRQERAHAARETGERLSLSDLRWSETPDQRPVGRGTGRLGGGARAQSAGTLEIELLPWLGDYKSFLGDRLERP
jgi:hypothetical protein